MSGKAIPTVLIDNARTRLTKWHFAPGAATGFHRHAFDYVGSLTTSRLKLVEVDGSAAEADLTASSPYSRSAGVAHDVINDNAHEFVFIEIEHEWPRRHEHEAPAATHEHEMEAGEPGMEAEKGANSRRMVAKVKWFLDQLFSMMRIGGGNFG